MSPNFKKGFTLTELLVTMGVMTIILTVILFNQSNYTDKSSLRNAADTILLDLSRAQVYGVGVRDTNPGSATFNVAYGIKFDLTIDSHNYIYFADKDGNKYYDGSWTCTVGIPYECLERLVLSGGSFITQLCFTITTGAQNCNINKVDITYKRPSTVANVVLWSGNNIIDPGGTVALISLTLTSLGGNTRSVTIRTMGISET